MKHKILSMVDVAISRCSVFAPVLIVLIGLYTRDKTYIRNMLSKHKVNKACLPLLDIDIFNKRIKNVKELARSAHARTKFYVIRFRSSVGNSGLFAYVENCLTQIFYALAKGMIPVIDMQTYPSIYMDNGELGHVNIWEKYFKQPCGYSLNDICDKRKVYSSGRCLPSPDFFPIFVFKEQHYFPLQFTLHCALHENFFSLSDDAKEYIEQEYQRIFSPGIRVLGVFCRGTDYTRMCPSGHPAQPNVDDVVKKVKEAMPEWGCDYVYVTSEERKVVERFENTFPGKVLTVSQCYYDDLDIDYSQTYIARADFSRENDRYLKGLEYLSSVICFSRCTSAVMGVTTGSIAALYINGGKYENTHIFNLGFYP